jgi:virginiamycin A acetyltransferase
MKLLIKRLALACCCVLVGPLILMARLGLACFRSEGLFVFGTNVVAIIPGRLGSLCRVAFYRFTLDEFHIDSFILFGTLISSPRTRIGHKVAIGEYAIIGYSFIGDNVGLSSKCSILAGRYQHNFVDDSKGIFDSEPEFVPVTIGKDSFVGEQAIVMANVGEKSIIGAGSVVVKDIPPYSVAVGNPAKVVKSRRPEGS